MYASYTPCIISIKDKTDFDEKDLTKHTLELNSAYHFSLVAFRNDVKVLGESNVHSKSTFLVILVKGDHSIHTLFIEISILYSL